MKCGVKTCEVDFCWHCLFFSKKKFEIYQHIINDHNGELHDKNEKN
jgi:hypothetical protein